MSADDIIIAGMSINFYCQQESKMLPFEVDQDSNFLLEVYCVDGEFQGFIKLEPTYFLVHIHTIRKSSKMDGAKYIPNFAFK